MTRPSTPEDPSLREINRLQIERDVLRRRSKSLANKLKTLRAAFAEAELSLASSAKYHAKVCSVVEAELAVRRIIMARTPETRCDDKCLCWTIAETDTDRGDVIQACDECNSYDRDHRLSDDDVALLPEAKIALRTHGGGIA